MPALRPAAHAKPVDEKITINVGFVDLGQIDLLVQEGFYANRSDLIRTAIRNQIAAHADTLKQAVGRRTLVLGIQHLGAAELEAVRARGETLDVRVLGLLTIAADVTPELALQTLRSVAVLGSLHATPAVKAALADRMKP
jgi:Arc/MetJ-type ribon-helix-helix transcriptional regulator